MKTILVVEDDVDVVEFLETLVRRERLFPNVAGNVSEAIKIIEKSLPELMLLDIVLPEKSGLELLKYLKDKNLNIPVIVITGKYNEEKLRRELITFYNIKDYLIKPINSDYLCYLIHKVLGTKSPITEQIEKKKLEFE